MVWLKSSGGALGKRDQFISRPLVIGIGSVLHSFDLPGGRDQKVGRKAQRASREPQAKVAVRHPAHGGSERLKAHEAKRRFHAEFFVEDFRRIADDQERNILLV